MAIQQILGKVGVVPKGEYNGATRYTKLDIVKYNGQSYMALAETIGNLPTNTEYWQLLIEKPVKGTDYYTAQEQAEMVQDVITGITPTLNQKADKSEIPDVSDFITKDVNNLTNYYDKNAVDTKISSVYKYKGTVLTYNDLPSSNLTVGDVYNIETADSTHGVKAGDNVAWTGTTWDVLAGTVDLSGKEDKSNKVTSISSSSTNTQYPSAKVVYDELKEKQDQIDALVEENTTLKAQIPTGYKKVSSTTLTDVSEGLPIENVTILGAISQKTTEGNQLINFTSGYYTNNNSNVYSFENDILTFSSSQVKSARVYWTITDLIKNNPGKKLYFSYDNINVTNQEGTIAQINITYNDDTPNAYIVLLNHNLNHNSYTIANDTSNISSVIFNIFSNNSNDNTNNYSVVIEKPQLQFGETAKTYEEYTGGQISPSIAYPQTVHKVTGNCNEKVQNKNIFDGQLENGTLISGETSSNSNLRRSKNYMKIKPNTNYVFSINGTANRVVANFYDENKNWIEQSGNAGLLSTTGIFTSPANAEYFKFRGYQDDTALLSSGNIMLEENSTATDYIAHAEQNAPLTLEDIELYDGDKIQISYVNQAGYKKVTGANVVKKIKERVLTGIENWVSQSPTGFYRYGLSLSEIINDNSLSDDVLIYSNYFKGVSFDDRNTDVEETIYVVCNGTVANSGFLINTKEFSTLESFKTWLSSNNVYVVYQLATPITTAITDTTLLSQLETLINLKTYKEVTHIDATGADLAPVLEFNYYKDMTTIFDNLEARVELLEN